MAENPRLTGMTKSAGCAAKLGQGTLTETLASLPRFEDVNLLIGFDNSDDACVYKIRDGLAVIQTVDFFPPVVDDAYLYGQIAAANALSDIYAMGGEPSLALNLLCVPKSLPISMVKQILEGGYSKVKEAGAVIAGGHTIEDPEPKYGLCVSGFIDPKDVWSNAGAKAGDVLVLTKPLGIGISNTAAKVDMLDSEVFKEACAVMATLNKYARDTARELGVSACTDVTGFGLIGHAREMAEASKVTLEIVANEPALLPCVEDLAKTGLIPEGAYRNRDYSEKRIKIAENVPLHMTDILFDPQTSGGLLFALPQDKADILLDRLSSVTPYARIIGRALPESDVPVSVV